jgi:ribose-phosphate pyrophosphokinase
LDVKCRKDLAATKDGLELFMPGAAEALEDPAIERLVVTDAVPAFRLGDHAVRTKIDVLASAPLLAEAIHRLRDHRGLADLMVF